MSEITQDAVRAILDYDPATGVFVRRSTGQLTGYRNSRGYVIIGIGQKTFKAHRLAWLHVYGRMPAEIDHADGDKANNRIDNLREADGTMNNANKPKQRNNRSGFKGVHFSQASGKWHAMIKKGRRARFLGAFESPADAHAAYVAAAENLFGEFARAC